MTGWQKTIKYLAMAFAILIIVNIIGGIFWALSMFNLLDDDQVLDQSKSYTVSSDIKGFLIDIKASDLYIKVGEEFKLESNIENLKVEENNNRLSIIENGNAGFYMYNKGTVTLTIPKNYELYNADITTGAGFVSIDILNTKNFSIELGAGKAEIKNISAKSNSHIEGGAGKLALENCNLNNLNLDVGVGEFNFSGAITGNSEIDFGIGAANVNINGNKQDYSVSIDKGIGEISIDGISMGDDQEVGNGTNRLEISGGIGSIKVNFEQGKMF